MEEEAEKSRGNITVVEVDASDGGADNVLRLRTRVSVKVIFKIGAISDPLIELEGSGGGG